MTHRIIGLVGCGRWGRLVLRDLNALGVRVVVVADIDPHARAAADMAGAVASVAAPEALPAVDGLIIATPAMTHAPVVTALLPRDVPVLVEPVPTTRS